LDYCPIALSKALITSFGTIVLTLITNVTQQGSW
jgi:hypothetical protein